ncbi:hypothetical protein ACWEPB_22005 [Kitasatospora cineracea]
MNTIMPQQRADDLDHLYTRYACHLQAGVTERLAAVGPAATVLDEDVAQDVWAHVAEHGLPSGRTGLDALLAVADRIVAQVRTAEHRRREIPVGLTLAPTTTPAARRGTCTTQLFPSATVFDAVSALRALPLAG